MDASLIIKKKAGRPPKNNNTTGIEKIVEIETKEPKKLGRPKKVIEIETVKYDRKMGRPKLPEELKKNQFDVIVYRKQYYEANKEKYLGVVNCDVCKKSYGRTNHWRHIDSKLHLKLLKEYEKQFL